MFTSYLYNAYNFSKLMIKNVLSPGLIIFFTLAANAESINGFDLSNSSINRNEITAGGPPRDGIPSIDHPKFINVNKVSYLQDNDIVIGLVRGNIARAYPTRILVWHEVVNDIIGNEAVVITYCPLCATGMVFSRNIQGKIRTFGVSGLLYRSDILMYDRETNSLWSQLAMKAVTGAAMGQKLVWLPSEYSTWMAWRRKHPAGQVLSLKTGFRRNYTGSGAYASYHASKKTMFPVPRKRQDLPDKELVIGVLINGKAKAYPIKTISKVQKINDTVGKKTLIVRYKRNNKSHQIIDSHGKKVPSVLVYWFAWQAFYPETEIWKK